MSMMVRLRRFWDDDEAIERFVLSEGAGSHDMARLIKQSH
jgi:hypothetical protein